MLLSGLFVAVNVVLALGQWDANRVEFRPSAPVETRLTRGAERIVYLGATESEPLNFDFYPGDFRCFADGPSGRVDFVPARQQRLLNLWDEHAAVGSLISTTTGDYAISCSGRDATLVLAPPARFVIGWASPSLSVFFLAVVWPLAAAPLLVGSIVGRRRSQRASGEPAACSTNEL